MALQLSVTYLSDRIHIKEEVLDDHITSSSKLANYYNTHAIDVLKDVN